MKKMIILPVAIIAMMAVSCGPSQDDVAKKEKAVADSTSAYNNMMQAQADSTAAAAKAQAIADSTATANAKAQAIADSIAAMPTHAKPAKKK